MNNRKFKIELLAPAKDKECAIAAINCGADAVYIGASSFGARQNATNTLEDIKEIVDYAHKFRVKIFATINTLLHDNELEPARKLIWNLYEIGVDAIIIQDMGLLELDLPPIALHSSTQCHNSTLEKVQFLEKTGFERAILARELSIEEIKNIANNTEIELETFVHGALCVSYSGQCYLSYAIGGRSANRGECAQPCRKKYTLIDANGNKIAENKHLLCLKDFNATNSLEELVKAGVSSFKIEGRLKDVTYIKNTVTHYRRELDKIIEKYGLERASIGTTQTEFTPDLEKAFNRGYCDYFLNGRKQDITSFNTPKFVGEFIGKITKITQHYFELDGKPLKNADGITFFDENDELCGTKVDKVEAGRVFPNSMSKLKVGLKIYRNYSHEFNKNIETVSIKRKISVNIEFLADKEITIAIFDIEGNCAEIELANNFEPAQNTQKAEENIKKQLSKLGETEFFAENIKISGETLPFIKINELNDLRRQVVEKFQQVRVQNYERPAQRKLNHPQFIRTELTYKDNVINEKAKEFYERCGATVEEYGLEHPSQKNLNDKQLMEIRHCIRYSMGMCTKDKNTKNPTTPLFLIDETGKKYSLNFDCKNCKMTIIQNK